MTNCVQRQQVRRNLQNRNKMYGKPLAININNAKTLAAKYKNALPEITAKGGEYIASGFARGIKKIGNIGIISIFGELHTTFDWFCFMTDGTSYDQIKYCMDELGKDKEIEKIVLNFGTPGGSVFGCPEMSEYIQYFDKNIKPVYSYVGTEAASAGYYLASAARRVFGHRSAFVGSIGTLAIFQESEDKEEIVISSTQSPLKSVDVHVDEGKQQIQKHLDHLTDIFIKDVAKYRNTDPVNVANNFGRGDIVHADEALAVGMIDAIMNFDDCITWIQTQSVQNGIVNTLQSPEIGANGSTGLSGKKLKMRGNKMAKRKFLSEFVLIEPDAAGDAPVVEVTIDVIKEQFPEIATALIDEGKKMNMAEGEEVETEAANADPENPAEMELVAKARKREISAIDLVRGLVKAKSDFKKMSPDKLADIQAKRRSENPPITDNKLADSDQQLKTSLADRIAAKRKGGK